MGSLQGKFAWGAWQLELGSLSLVEVSTQKEIRRRKGYGVKSLRAVFEVVFHPPHLINGTRLQQRLEPHTLSSQRTNGWVYSKGFKVRFKSQV